MNDAMSLQKPPAKEIRLPPVVHGAFRLQDLMKTLWRLGITISDIRELGAAAALQFSARHTRQDRNDQVVTVSHDRLRSFGDFDPAA